MREDQKKHDEEMLVVHKPGAKADPKKAGGPAPAVMPRAASLDKHELELIKKQIGMSKDPGVRRDLVAQIQHKFGNDKATEVVREMRLKTPDDDMKSKPAGAGGKAPPKGKV